MKKVENPGLDWLDTFNQEDPANALESAIEQLRALALNGNERMLWLYAVDNALKLHATELMRRFSEARRLPAEDEARFWNAGSAFHDLLAAKMVGLLRELGDKSVPASEAPSIVARTLFHRGQSALWRYLRYVAIPDGWWLDTHKIFAFAEREQISTTQAPISDVPTHAAAIYLQLLLLDTLNRTNMERRQIVALSSWLAAQTDAIAIERSFEVDQQLFYVRLDEDKGGRRIRNFEPTPNCRYWRTDELLAEIELELEKAESGQSPEIDAELLHQMYAEWSRIGYKRQRRIDERNDVKKKASVAHGIYAVCQEVHSQALGSTHLAIEGETWGIENESLNGFGATVSAELNTWLKVGRLLTLREEMNFGMSVVAVIRSLQQIDGGNVYVGAEILSYMALYTLLQDWPVNGSQPYPGIFIAADEERLLPSSVLIPHIEYQPNAELRLKLDRRMRHVKLGKIMEQKDDWCRVAIDVMEDLN